MTTRGLNARAASTLWLGAAVASVFAFAWLHMDLLGDGCWYIATGRYVLAHHAFPKDELFAYSAVRGPWFVNMPLSEPLFAWVSDHLGVRALLAMCTATFGGGLLLCWLPHTRGRVARLVTWPLVVFATFVQRDDLQARSQALADLLLGVLFLLLFRVRDGRRVPHWMPLLLGAVWVNVHPSFLLGVLLPLGLATGLRIGPADHRPPLRPIVLLAALIGVAGLVNPYGYRLIGEFLRFLTAESTTAIDLFQSPDFHKPDLLAAIVFAALVTFACLRRASRDVGTGEALLLVAILAETCASRRYVDILVAYAIVLTGRLLSTAPWADRALPASGWLAALAPPVLLAALSLRPTKDPWHNLPVEAAAYIDEHHLDDNVLNILHWGGYLDYAWGGRRRIFIDGRTTQFENGVLTDHGLLANLTPGWGERLDTYLVNTVLWENGGKLDVALSQDPAWQAVYRKGIAVVYVRKTPLR